MLWWPCSVLRCCVVVVWGGVSLWVQEFLKANALSSLEEIQALEALVQQVEAFDVRPHLQPFHRLRLLQHSAPFACSVCRAAGQGWAWRCIVAHCPDSIHLNCLTGRQR